ncbi:hypothetical protein OG948_04250 [Embleya sp. NBC_00888]|uniref:hypothetical protein n=1 Tax=Embleya sp. NBC_00888 TaxID=2975960 RepID=UPI003866B319|nr:hypothetical protein OG948_04250 [Embleya sp. NBC_00888]
MTRDTPAAESGFVYVRDDRPGPMAGAAVGRRIVKADLAPPWIVVDRALATVIVSGRPGRLYRVAVVPPESEAERAAMAEAAEGVRVPAPYTRAFAVDVLAEVPPAALFGPHGAAVVGILDAARALTPDTAARLAAALEPRAGAYFGAAWDRWIDGEPNAAPYRDRDHTYTLSIPGASALGSPIGRGFLVVSGAVRAAARERGGPAAFEIEYDEDDEQGDEVLTTPWRRATHALLHAAMALGAPHLTAEPDRAILTGPWRAIGNADVGPGRGPAR